MSIGLMVPSQRRPIPLKRRPDLVTALVDGDYSPMWVIKDPLGLKYHRLEPEQYTILTALDGERSLQELRNVVVREHPASTLTLPEIQSFIVDLHQQGLVYSQRTGQGPVLRQRHFDHLWQRLPQLVTGLLSLRLPGWNPDTWLTWLLPRTRWIYHPLTIAFCSLIVVSAWLLLLVQFQEFRARLPNFEQFFGWPNLIWLWVTLALTKVLHEHGHGLTCRYYGSECHEMGVMLLVFSPCLYCDVSDSWLLRNRWHRIWIAAAGMLFEIVLSGFAIWVWWLTEPGLWHYLALNIFFVSTVSTVIFNANPLLRYDGYYMLSDWLGIPNLRSKSDRLLDRQIARYAFGLQMPEDPLLPKTNQGWFALYSVAATAYSWFIFTSILLFLYTWLKPRELQSLGIAAAAFSLLGMIISLGNRIYRVAKTPRQEKLKPLPLVLTGLALIASVWLVLAIPIPWYIDAAVVIEPEGVVHVYTARPGILKEVLVEPDATVSPGQPLLRQENPQIDDRVSELEDEWAKARVSVSAAEALEDRSELAMARERFDSVTDQLAEAKSEQRLLELRAPIAGVVVAPERKPRPKDAATKSLATWYGTPLDERNLGTTLDERTMVLSLAPSSRLQALLYIPQVHRNEISTGQHVAIKLDALPDQTFRGEIVELSSEQLETAPVALSNKAGGPLATKADGEGSEHLQEITYGAKVHLEDEQRILRSGMRGTARFIIAEHTAGWWLWRTIRQTIHFRL